MPPIIEKNIDNDKLNPSVHWKSLLLVLIAVSTLWSCSADHSAQFNQCISSTNPDSSDRTEVLGQIEEILIERDFLLGRDKASYLTFFETLNKDWLLYDDREMPNNFDLEIWESLDYDTQQIVSQNEFFPDYVGCFKESFGQEPEHKEKTKVLQAMIDDLSVGPPYNLEWINACTEDEFADIRFRVICLLYVNVFIKSI